MCSSDLPATVNKEERLVSGAVLVISECTSSGKCPITPGGQSPWVIFWCDTFVTARACLKALSAALCAQPSKTTFAFAISQLVLFASIYFLIFESSQAKAFWGIFFFPSQCISEQMDKTYYYDTVVFFFPSFLLPMFFIHIKVNACVLLKFTS